MIGSLSLDKAELAPLSPFLSNLLQFIDQSALVCSPIERNHRSITEATCCVNVLSDVRTLPRLYVRLILRKTDDKL